MRRRVFLFSLASLAGAEQDRVRIVPRAHRPAAGGAAPASIRVDTELVLIPVTVTDVFGSPYRGLGREAFRLFEDGVEQQIKAFSCEEAPVSLGIVFDASRSMRGKLDEARVAVARFMARAVEGDEYFVLEFNDRVRLRCDFTTDTRDVETALSGIEPKNWTALVDAVYAAIHRMRRAGNARKALLILSDGGDNYSRYTEGEMKEFLREADVCVYSVALQGGGLIKRHIALLRQIAQETGGLLCPVSRLEDLPEAIEKINAAIRQQYLLGYTPTNRTADGLYRKVEVRLVPESPGGLRATWRAGYYAPLKD
ncbi:MAG: VWA domain-containing protein [Bryobacterales bacterium]|nr:VWA domain-containing protein [Bryobacterales bacterium]